ncbi:MAG: asparagine synthase (glutamine-hydrolyzing) [Planctomycetota bacterium]
MCGICGIVMRDPRQRPPAGLAAGMCARLAHRGPDGEGVHEAEGVALGHRRLAIVDLSPAAAQPLFNEDGFLALAMNGEIYNHTELREGLERRGHRFKSRCDAEVILHLYEEHGHGALEHLEGMFSFALWDGNRRELFAARDRAGEKPFHYHAAGDRLVFASEPAALWADRSLPREPNSRAVFDYLSFGYVPAPLAGVRGAAKLPPGHFLVYREGNLSVQCYWQPERETPDFIGSEEEVADRVRGLLKASIAKRLRADVEVGLFLSGGLDSGAIAAEARTLRPDLRTFTMRFADADYDESALAARTAAALGLRHEIVDVEGDPAGFLPGLAARYGEPFADSSCIPAHLIARAVAGRVKVVLAGDGGDELFGGYDRYRAYRYQVLLHLLPRFIRRPALHLVELAGRGGRRGSLRRRAARFARVVRMRGYHYSDWLFFFTHPQKLAMLQPAFLDEVGNVHQSSEAQVVHLMVASGAGEMGERAMAADFLTYLPGDLLTKVDIAAMGHGLEVRTPFLEPDLMAAVRGLPYPYKINHGVSKYILRRAYRGVLPPPVLRQGKRGFAVPLAKYLAGPLAPLVRENLGPSGAFARTVVRPQVLDAILRDGPASDDHAPLLFSLLMLELWHGALVRG